MPTDRLCLSRARFAEVDRLMIEVYGIALIQRMQCAGPRLAEFARPLPQCP
jgi:hypothetical protein